MNVAKSELFDRLPYAIAQLILDISRSEEVDHLLIMSRLRTKRVALARQVAMTVIRGKADRYTLQDVGDFFGRDHATVLHAQKLIAAKMREGDPGLASTLASAFRTYAAARKEIEASQDGLSELVRAGSRETLTQFQARQVAAAADGRALK